MTERQPPDDDHCPAAPRGRDDPRGRLTAHSLVRIAYFAHVNGGGRTGVFHKIAGQVEQWRAEGQTVRAFVLTRDEVREWQSSLGDSVIHRYDGFPSRMLAVMRLVRAIRSFRPSIVYLRWDLFYPQMLFIPPRAALVVEVNTDDLSEFVLGRRIRAFYNARTRGLILLRAQGLVFVTNELSASAPFHRFCGRRAVVTNGIRLESYATLPAPKGGQPRLVFIGTPGHPWHGIDKLITLASIKSDWHFDIIGTRNETGVPLRNITWHGSLERAAAVEVLGHADVGIGTLALHRKSMNEACPLKVREYLAVGLPVIYAHRDPDADLLDSLTLRIANTESNVIDELSRIEEFVEGCRGRRVPRSEVAHIDVARKELQRLALFEQLAGG
jgi:glycosyltransferase involved in cell wall biosynthesis